MQSLEWNALISACCAAVYLLLATLATQRGAGYGRITRLMIWYGVVAALWELVHLFAVMGRLTVLGDGLAVWHRALGPLLLMVLFVASTIEFLLAGPLYWGWILAGVIWLVLALLMVILGLSMEAGSGSWLFWFIASGWLGLVLVSEALTWFGRRKVRSEGQRRRIVYWMAGTVVLAAGDVLLFARQDVAGSLVHLLGVMICGYVVFVHGRDDLVWTARRSAAFVVEALIGLLVYSLVLSIPFLEFSIGSLTTLEADALSKAIFLVLVVSPLLAILQTYLNRTWFGMGFDQGALVRAYSAQISSIVHLPRLVQAALSQINDIFKLQKSCLFVVDKLEAENVYVLTPVRSSASKSVQVKTPGRLNVDSPIIHALLTERKPLLQNEIDLHTLFKHTPPMEREWLEEQQMEVYVPVFTQGNLVGLFGLGPKISGEHYLPQDLDLLILLADQTAGALVNARLFDRANQLNAELKQAQEAILESNKKLRELDEMKSSFIGVLTHEMRTPLANIQFAAQVLHMYLKSNLTDEQRLQFDELNAAVKTARGLIDNLVNFAAFLNQQVDLNLEELDFREILRESLTPLKPQIDQKGLKVHLNMLSDTLRFQGDRKLIKEVLFQLASNAVKFTPKGEIRIACWTTKDALCFDIEDTGIGIPEDKAAEVWDAFTQVGADSVKRGVEGLGLGLALVKFIVTAHGGSIWVESKLGEGSTFGFQLPLLGPGHPLPQGFVSRPQRLHISGV